MGVACEGSSLCTGKGRHETVIVATFTTAVPIRITAAMEDRRAGRMKVEIQRLQKDPPHGVSCWPKDGRLDLLEAKLLGDKNTPFEGGVFRLEIKIPERYPFEPPQVRFLTKIYHPNIDLAGRICLDVLKSQPSGSWKPAQNISTILTSIQQLVTYPNPDDGLMADISHEFKHNRPVFTVKAKQWVEEYAKEDSCPPKAAAAAAAASLKRTSSDEGGSDPKAKRPHLSET